jgi:dihydrolipoamide dehydrogenase
VPDLGVFQSWKDGIVGTLGDGVRARLRASDVTVVTGKATFTGPTSLRIEHGDEPSETWEFRGAVIATGSSATRLPALDGDPRVVDAAGVLALTERPERVVVVGGGYIGVELGTALAKLGSAVTIVEAGDTILDRLGRRAVADVVAGLGRLGVRVLTGIAVEGMDPEGVVVARADGAETEAPETIAADLVLVATGRRPNTEGLGLEAARVATTASGHIVVDSALLATPAIAAIGDVVAGPGLAHRASAQAAVAVAALAGDSVAWDSLVPIVVFSDPELAAVGLGLPEAIELGYDAAESVLPFGSVGRAHILQATTGHHSVVYDRVTGVLLGATITGSHATELISELAVAIEAGLLLGDVTGTIHPHPTLSELAVHEFGTPSPSSLRDNHH